MDVGLMLAKITEAYCVQKNIPIRRKFTDEELSDSKDLLAKAVADVEMLERPDYGKDDEYHAKPGAVTNHDLTADQRADMPRTV